MDYNLTGSSVLFTPGWYDMSDMIAKGMPNDQASSVYVPSGFIVHLYQNGGFDTLMGKYTGPKTVNISPNDQLSSLKVGSTTRCANMITHTCGCTGCVQTTGENSCDAEFCAQTCLDDPTCKYSF